MLISIWSWVVAHQGAVAALAVAVIDLLFAINPSLSGNGILHQILVIAQGKVSPPAA